MDYAFWIMFASCWLALAAWWVTYRRFLALRRNCFITNEKGHRVRYFDASPERQAKAEQ